MRQRLPEAATQSQLSPAFLNRHHNLDAQFIIEMDKRPPEDHVCGQSLQVAFGVVWGWVWWLRFALAVGERQGKGGGGQLSFCCK